MHKRFSQFAFGFMLLFALQAGAQTFAGKFSQVPQYMRIQKNEQVSIDKFPDWLAQHYKLPDGNGFKLLSTEKDKLGMVHYRYQQTINGIPVEFTMYILHTRNGIIESINGDLVGNFIAPEAPVLSNGEAISAALSYVSAVEYKWQAEGAEEALRENTGNPSATYYPQPQLVYIAKGNKLGGGVFNLAYKIDVYAVQPFSRRYIYIDALNGEVLYALNRIQHANANATAHTQYNGIQPIVADSVNATTYRLRETGRGNGIRTYNARRTTNPSNTDFFNTTKIWNNVNDSLDEYATDAHYASEVTHDFFMNNFGRNSVDDNGLILAAYVHFGVNYDNAFWDGGAMNYGDGSNQNNTTPYTTLDIGGHEITHGLTQFTADLIYENESGALNESFSDIMGVSIRQYARQSAVVDYVLGDQNGPPFRSMKNPKNYGNPDTYEGIYWITDTFDNGGVHINSGVQNHWFYIVAQGEVGSNDNGHAYNITGIGITAAQAIAYRTLTVYLTPTSQYADARKYSIKATEDLFGACSPEVRVVANAWYAVGVGNAFVQEVNSDFSTPVTNYCGVPATIAFIDSSTNAVYYEWAFGDGGTSNLQSPSHTYTSYGTYTVKLMSWSPDCGRDSVIKQQYITITDFTPTAATGADICSGSPATLSATGAGEIKWFETETGGTPVHSGTTFITPPLGQTTTYYVENQNPGATASAGPASKNFGEGGNNNSDHY
ncbi:MAG TPA: M4 family metallopeptidase, partial [Chitinophagales bacterium]|nr:M4 family metallopeptidase [Chitinophagales bacterium]